MSAKVELTYDDIRRAAETCPTAKEALRALCPAAFEVECRWEDVTNQVIVCRGIGHPDIYLAVDLPGNLGSGPKGEYSFAKIVEPESIITPRHWEIRFHNGRIERRRKS